MSEVNPYMARPVRIEAAQLKQFGDFVRAVDWINSKNIQGTSAFRSTTVGFDDVLILLKDGNVYDVFQGSYVIFKGGQFSFSTAEEFEATYDLVETPKDESIQVCPGSTLVTRETRHKNSPLIGGAALEMPG